MIIKRFPIGDYLTNCYVIYDESTKYAMIIDTAFQDFKIENYIISNNLDVKYIAFTHGHFDHIEGLKYYHDKFHNALILIHSFDAECLTDETKNFTYPAPYNFIPVKADKLLNDKDVFKLGNIEFKVIHTPGHTKGSICLYTEGHLISGDTLFKQSIGRTDFNGGSFEQITESILKLYKLPDNTIVYPGHGFKTSIGVEKFENPFVRVK